MSDKKYYAMIKGESGELEEVEIKGGNVINNTAFGTKGIIISDEVKCVIKDNNFSGGRKIKKLLERIDGKLKN